jgi:hypothetical protein
LKLRSKNHVDNDLGLLLMQGAGTRLLRTRNTPLGEVAEHLYRERHLMLAVGLCTAVFALLWVLDLPGLHDLLTPTVPALLAP